MNIGVSGASGNLGRAILRELGERAPNAKIVAVSRTLGTASSSIEARHGDYDKPETLGAAYAGLDKLVIIPTSDLRPGVRGTQNEAAIKAAVEAGVQHIVFVSAAGTREQAEPAIGASYWRGEQALVRSAPHWTIIRMNYYAESLADEAQSAKQTGMIAGFAENNVAFVSREDVAAAAAGILVSDGHSGAIYNATGSRTWTGAERAALVSETLAVPVAFAVVPVDLWRQGLAQAGLPDFVIDAVEGIQQDFKRGAFDIVSGDVATLAGRPPMDLREVLAAKLK